MKDAKKNLQIFNFSHPLMSVSLSLLGDKFASALPFKISIVDNFQNADIILWDGVITPKNKKTINRLVKAMGPSRLFLLLGESYTLLGQNEVVEVFDRCENKLVAGWSLLPEDLLKALLDCYNKLRNV